MYTKKDYSNLLGTPGFSDKALEMHLALYEGYVANTNRILEELEEYKSDSIQYAELKRRLGWEFDGMRLHEYYFETLGGDGTPDKNSKLYQALEKQFGNWENWKKDFVSTGKMRGIGCVILYQDPSDGRLINFWINEHSDGHPVGLNPILIMDVFEHAYFSDYGKDRASYIDAYMKTINWPVVEGRSK
jgi:Fe-Mn family superoxide dismutase